MQRYVCYICASELGDTEKWDDGMNPCPKCGETNVVPRFSKSEIAILLSCDFCGTDWDNKSPMAEGHKGSILCLPCLDLAIEQVAPPQDPTNATFKCTLCQQEKNEPDLPRWTNTQAIDSPGLNKQAAVCQDCIQQATRLFKKDKSVDWDGTPQ